MATKKKKHQHTLSEGSVTAFLMSTSEWESGGPYPLLSREWLASPDRFDDPLSRELADKIIAAYAAEHPLVANAEAIADAVDWKVLFGGLAHGMSLEQVRREVLPQARREVAEEVGKSPEAVKQVHTRFQRADRVKRRPR